jgi:hypothetical protein
MQAAFMGLIIGAIVLFAIVRTIVALTNAKSRTTAGRRGHRSVRHPRASGISGTARANSEIPCDHDLSSSWWGRSASP